MTEETKEEKNKICPDCKTRMARIVPTKINIQTNNLISEDTEAFICFNDYCSSKVKGFHRDKWWDWG